MSATLNYMKREVYDKLAIAYPLDLSYFLRGNREEKILAMSVEEVARTYPVSLKKLWRLSKKHLFCDAPVASTTSALDGVAQSGRFSDLNYTKLLAEVTAAHKASNGITPSFQSYVRDTDKAGSLTQKSRGCCSMLWIQLGKESRRIHYSTEFANMEKGTPNSVIIEWFEMIRDSEIGEMFRERLGMEWHLEDTVPTCSVMGGMGSNKQYFMALNLHRAAGYNPPLIHITVAVRKRMEADAPGKYSMQEAMFLGAALGQGLFKYNGFNTYAGMMTEFSGVRTAFTKYTALWESFRKGMQLPGTIESHVYGGSSSGTGTIKPFTVGPYLEDDTYIYLMAGNREMTDDKEGRKFNDHESMMYQLFDAMFQVERPGGVRTKVQVLPLSYNTSGQGVTFGSIDFTKKKDFEKFWTVAAEVK